MSSRRFSTSGCDADDGRALVVDVPGSNRWATLLASEAAVFGAAPWWPTVAPGVARAVLESFAPLVATRPARRPSHFADADLTILRTAPGAVPEIWCRCDGGPHRCPAIAAHADADAPSKEVRCGGTDVLADPGTYCHYGEPVSRRYFCSTVAYNTLELAGVDQSQSSGPFLWLGDASSKGAWCSARIARRDQLPDGPPRRVSAPRSASSSARSIASTPAGTDLRWRIASRVMARTRAGWRSILGRRWRRPWVVTRAILRLAAQLAWTVHSGEIDPPLGWYSPRFGVKQPTTMLLGVGICSGGGELLYELEFER
jgi:hypothetical protein